MTPESAGVLVVNDGPNESQNGNQVIDATLGIRPRPTAAPSVAAATASTATGKGVGKNGTPVEALHLMNETLVHHRLSRNGPVNLEVSAALTRMDIGKDVTRIWQRLEEFVTTDSHVECDKIVSEACAIADRLYNAQVGLCEAVYRREWNEDWAPLLSFVIPGTRSGGMSGCRFEHPDEHSNGPMSSLRLRMNSLGIDTVQNGPNECMVETTWYEMTRAERMFLTKGNWHIEWKHMAIAKENLTHDLVNVYD